MYGSYERTHSVFQNSEMMAKGEPSPEEIALLEPFRDRVSAGSVRAGMDTSGQRRIRAGSQVAARRRRSAQCRRLDHQGWQARERRRASSSRPSSCLVERRSSRTTRPSSRISRARDRRQYPSGRSVAGGGAARRISISTSRSRASSIRRFPEVRCAIIFPASSPGPRGRTISPGSPIPSSMRWSKRRSRRKARSNSIPPAALSTACCARVATGFRTGARLLTGSPIGISSASRRRSRAMRAARRKRGGSRPARPPRSSRRNSP